MKNLQREAKDTGALFLRYPKIGLFLFLLGLGLFLVAYISVEMHTFFYEYDQTLLDQFRIMNESLSTGFLGVVKGFGEVTSTAMGVLTALFALLWLFQRKMRKFYLVLASVGGAELFWLLLTFLIGRSRPSEVMIFGVPLSSFPSGHIMVMTAFLGFFLYLSWLRIGSSRVRALLVLAVLIFLVIVSLDRLIVLAHYFSDILGGFGMGLAWLVLSTSVSDHFLSSDSEPA